MGEGVVNPKTGSEHFPLQPAATGGLPERRPQRHVQRAEQDAAGGDCEGGAESFCFVGIGWFVTDEGQVIACALYLVKPSG